MPDSPADEQARLAEIAEREKVATPGPWTAEFPQGLDTQWFDIVAGPNREEILHGESEPLLYWVHPDSMAALLSDTEVRQANLEFCAHARADIPWLLKLVEERTAKLVASQTDIAYCANAQIANDREEKIGWLEARATEQRLEIDRLRRALYIARARMAHFTLEESEQVDAALAQEPK